MRIKWRLQVEDEPEWGDSFEITDLPVDPDVASLKSIGDVLGNTVRDTLVRMLERKLGLPDSEDARMAAMVPQRR